MNLPSALPSLVGDYGRFGQLADRVEGLVELQVAESAREGLKGLVLPWTDGFYLFTDSTEAQRQAREVVVAFLGPAVVSIEPISERQLDRALPSVWKSTGLNRASYLRRVDPGSRGAEEMLSRLEDMVASASGRTTMTLEIKATHVDLLRDLRLAFLQKDDDAARRLFDEIRLNGHVSSENLRFLRIEYLAAFSRWTEMRELPHINAMVRARRPTTISETLFQMIWWTELVSQGHQGAFAAFDRRGVVSEFGPLLRAINVPSTQEGRAVALLTALFDDDLARQQAILDRAQDPDEEADLRALIALDANPVPSAQTAVESPVMGSDLIVDAFESGRFQEMIEYFLADPNPAVADLAVQAILESGLSDRAESVLALVQAWAQDGAIVLGRRTRRDIDELKRLTDDSCGSWVEWAQRMAADARWADAGAVVRDRARDWTPLCDLPAEEVDAIADSLLSAAGDRNDDQLRASLDILCQSAASLLAHGGANDFCQVVLVLLSEQDNFSEMVRAAHLDLVAAWVQSGPSAEQYGEVVQQSGEIWTRISSPFAVDWAIGVLEALIDAPSPDPARRSALAVQLIDGARQFYARLTARERVELETLAGQFGLQTQAVEAAQDEQSVWARADGTLVGIYSLLPRAAALLESRLSQLCQPREVRGNSDLVSSQSLRSLAERADHLIVDTWHAAHQATAAIDVIRPKDRQILPRQRGITGFLRALEEALET